MSDSNVYVIHSSRPIAEIREALAKCGGCIYVGIIYKSFDREGGRTQKVETRKTIVICKEQTVRELERRYPEYKGNIADYSWSSFPLPNEENGETWSLHVSGVPCDYTVKDAEDFIVSSLRCILQQTEDLCDGSERRNFTVEFAPRSRETGEIYGYGRVHFADHVPRETIKLCKLILHNTPLRFKAYPEQTRMVVCVWFRPPQPNDSRRGSSRNNRRAGRAERYHPAQKSDVRVDVSSLSTISKSGVAAPSKRS